MQRNYVSYGKIQNCLNSPMKDISEDGLRTSLNLGI